MAKVSPKLRSQAIDAVLKGRYEEAVSLYEKLLAIVPRDSQALNNIAIAYDALGRYDKFYEMALRGLDVAPDDVGMINVVAIAEYKLGMHKAAYERLMRGVDTHGMTYEIAMNLCSVCGELELHSEGLKYALDAVQLSPTKPSAHNNLGSAFMSLGKTEEAKHCFETTLILEKDNAFAHTNLGVLLNKESKHIEAIERFEKALKLLPTYETQDTSRNRFFMGLSQLAIGNLEEGWLNYEYGWKLPSNNGRNPKRTFDVPCWKGEDLSGKTILVWREQGLGDEIFFFSAVKHLFALGGRVIIECDPRLVPTLQRSYPTSVVRAQTYYLASPHKSFYSDFDYQIPAGSLFAHFYNETSKFNESGPYIKVPEHNVKVFDERLGPRNGALRVGICWRSGDLNATRNVHYSALSDWEEIFKIQGLQFINLQYGEVRKEVQMAETEYEISLNNWSDIDRKDNLDELAALISTLDLVISVGTAVAQISAAVGVPVWLMHIGNDWPQFGQANYPVYPNVKMIKAQNNVGIPGLLKSSIPMLLKRMVAENIKQAQSYDNQNTVY
jgi:tetratricopeptide (TPR) repeat protein